MSAAGNPDDAPPRTAVTIEWSFKLQGMFSRSLKDVPSGPDRDTAIQKVVNDLKVMEFIPMPTSIPMAAHGA